MPRVVHFEISVDDPERAIRFYSDVFGWKIEKWEGPMDYWLITTGPENEPGIDGALIRRQDPAVPTIKNKQSLESDIRQPVRIQKGTPSALSRTIHQLSNFADSCCLCLMVVY
jgi:catechol 2,3-dioxygenase-like lactoylglutathione lyase family enzyme